MSDDDREAPTPRQSGTYGMMLGICRDSQLDLEHWLKSAPESVTERLIFLIHCFKKCGAEVQQWTIETPSADKLKTRDNILALRAEAQDLAKAYGHRLR